ncbi:hypothetical protein V6N13_087218 [Hibiscus sabdariffa]
MMPKLGVLQGLVVMLTPMSPVVVSTKKLLRGGTGVFLPWTMANLLMGNFLAGFLLPQLLLMAALSNWSLICLVDLIAFLLIQYTAPKIGYKQSVGEAWWMELIGFMIIQSWKSPTVIYFLAVQLLVVFVALLDIHDNRFGLVSWHYSCWIRFLTAIERLGSCDLRIFLDCSFAFWTGDEIIELCSLLECLSISHFDLYNNSLSHMIKSDLVVGISHPSWVSLPFFVGSCVGLVDWSLTSNFLGLFRFWRALQLYAGFIIVLLYLYQLPLEFSNMLQRIADFVGLFKMSSTSEWPEICSAASLVHFYIMWCYSTFVEYEFHVGLMFKSGLSIYYQLVSGSQINMVLDPRFCYVVFPAEPQVRLSTSGEVVYMLAL